MDHETLAKDLVAGYVAGHDLPEKNEMQNIAESLIEFYNLTKAEVEKSQGKAEPAPIGFGSRSADAKKPREEQE
jgi:hypothetical protein